MLPLLAIYSALKSEKICRKKRNLFSYRKGFRLYRKPFDQCGGYFNFYGMWHGGPDLTDQLGGGCFSHEFTGDVDGGEGGVYDAAFGDVVEACDGDGFGNLVAAEFQGFDGADGDEVVVCEVGACQWGSAVDDLQHVGEGSFDGGGEFVNDGFGSGHSISPASSVETVRTFPEVCDFVGGAEVSWLAAAAVDKVAGGLVGALGVVAENTAAVCRIKVGIQKDNRDGELKELVAYRSGYFGSKKDDTCTLGNAEFFDVFLEIVCFFVELEGFQMIAVFTAFLFNTFGEL